VGNSAVANGFGLFDMHGNVSEWCFDKWHDNYVGAPIDGSAWEDTDQTDTTITKRVVRGGDHHSSPLHCRSAARSLGPPNEPAKTIGFRVALVRNWQNKHNENTHARTGPNKRMQRRPRVVGSNAKPCCTI